MRQTRKEKTSQKLTRWDRIRKRNTCKNASSLKTDIVKHFIEKDYINQHDESLLCGKSLPNKVLNPALVMDMRHEMFRKIPRKLPLATVGGLRTLDACVNHNLAVEERYIMNELSKFRQQLQKNRKRNTLRVKITQSDENNKIYDMDNEYLTQSLVRAAKHIENFYAAPLEALQRVDEVCEATILIKNDNELEEAHLEENFKGVAEIVPESDFKADVSNVKIQDDYLIKDTNIEIANNEHIETVSLSKYSEKIFEEVKSRNVVIANEPKSNLLETNLENKSFGKDQQFLTGARKCPDSVDMESNGKVSCKERCVRFVEAVNIKNFDRENSICSNTSDGIDSVVSDLAEEALFELQMEAEEKLIQESESNMESKKAAEPIEVQINFKDTTSQYVANALEPLVITKLSKPKEVDSAITTSEELEDESISNHEQNLIIQQLFRPRANTNPTLLRKYFLKWIHFVTIEKIEREDVSSKSDRVHKINMFLDKIRKEKLRLTRYARQCNSGQAREETQKTPVVSTQTTKKYQNKIKIQQDIIDLQRLKLERQERIIMELKLNKLSDEAKEAREDLKNELKTIIRHGDPKFKAKAKCLQLIGNLRDEKDENMTSLQGKALFMPKFLLQMEERALERNIRHEKARQRRLQQEAEKEAQKMAAEEAKRLEDEEAKRLRIEALKEKRRQEKMAKVLKEREHQRALEAKHKADEFYRRLLLRRIGMEGFKRLIIRKRENKRKCEHFRRQIFKRTYFVNWRDYYIKLRNEKQLMADDLYDKIIKRKTLCAWQLYVQQERSKFNVAVDWCDLKRTEITFKLWAQHSARMSAIAAAKMKQATSHHEWHLKWKVLDCWQRLPQILQLERETEERRQRWRMKIWELLPDYTPNRDSP
ncbi:putative autophagy-related protein 11 [Bactrocera dorsalis]|uniref:Autophagy-related protein 11 n=1 Tax=Bactrocera dorsalis TaxID=27457 RepID=A0ABM3J0V3_BACDO|nr:putative autophagy-related protein 11 [Bactrocera dorsalis]